MEERTCQLHLDTVDGLLFVRGEKLTATVDTV